MSGPVNDHDGSGILKRYKGTVSTNKVGSECEFEFEIEDGATEEEIEAAAREAMFDHIEWNFEPATEVT